jgi:hypothetical protein
MYAFPYIVLIVLLVSGGALENSAMLWISIVGIFALTISYFIFGNSGPAPEADSGLTSMDGTGAPTLHGSGYAHGVNTVTPTAGQTHYEVGGSGFAADSSGADSTSGDYGGGDDGGSDGGGDH